MTSFRTSGMLIFSYCLMFELLINCYNRLCFSMQWEKEAMVEINSLPRPRRLGSDGG